MMTDQALTRPSKTIRSALLNRFYNLAFTSGLVRLDRKIAPHSLTVLNYHRIGDANLPDFDTFKPNVSADQNAFAGHLEYISRWFKVVSMQHVINWLNRKGNLPAHAALITFDDGYLDNFTNAYPLLRKHDFPAVIFLTTGHINSVKPFYWDLAAFAFFHTHLDHLDFPDGQVRTWSNVPQRDLVCHAWIESLKSMPDEIKQTWIERLPEKLGVAIPSGYFGKLMLNWDQIREMRQHGIEFGGHTINHPILSRVSLEQAQLEIEGSKNHIEKELGQPVSSFAYPNGMPADIHLQIQKLVVRAGYQAAFTLINGPSSLSEVRKNPFAIRRIFISQRHNLPRFAAQLSWFNRIRS